MYAHGFTFANYDFIVVSKPSSDSSTPLYGMDVEFGNLMASLNMKVIGDKEFGKLSQADKIKTLFARLSLSASSDRNLLSVSFDDAESGKTVCSISQVAKGDMLDEDERTKALDSVTRVIARAVQRDKGLTIAASR